MTTRRLAVNKDPRERDRDRSVLVWEGRIQGRNHDVLEQGWKGSAH